MVGNLVAFRAPYTYFAEPSSVANCFCKNTVLRGVVWGQTDGLVFGVYSILIAVTLGGHVPNGCALEVATLRRAERMTAVHS